MYEKERQLETNLLLLIIYTLLIIVLAADSFFLGWDMGAVILLVLGAIVSWWIHITEKVPETMRVWLCLILSMLAFFFYGIHETSIYDLALAMILVMVLYSVTENYNMIRLCEATYILTVFYDIVFVIGDLKAFSLLTVVRFLLHLLMVCLTAYLIKSMMQRHSRERKNTDRKISELEEANRRTEDFLTNVSHELRTPINAVTGMTAVLLKKEEDADKRKDLLSIQTAGHRLFGQIGDILDYTEIDTGRIKVSENTYVISSLINDLIIGNHLTERESMPELIFDIDADIPAVLVGDDKKIQKILEHLIDNAFKFTKKGGIYVRVYALHKPYGINLCIRVSDTGAGIEEVDLEKIKERFYQSDSGRNRKAGGLGLGLSIVYGMVSAMEGFIQMESTVGKGTTVFVSIPQKVADEAPVMVVENREELCLACYLRPEKYEVPEVRDYYNEMISNLVQGLEIPLHRITSIEDLGRLTSLYQLTHLFIGGEEYEENQSCFEELSPDIEVIVVADNHFAFPQGSRVKLLKKPFYSLPLVNILNAGEGEDEVLKGKRMICPGIRVLVVDDEPMNRMVAEEIFRDYQMSVVTAESGREAVKLCEKEDFDLIFLDHMMPEMDGVETLKRLRKIYTDTGRVLTVIAFTANAVSGAREMFLQEGFDEFVSKPVEPLEMERVLRKMLPRGSISFVDEKYRKQEEDDKITRLERSGIHTRSGMQYCHGDKRFYEELLAGFAKDAKQKETEINNFFLREDFENYGIKVHALKSTAKMVGADSLSENAKLAEAAAKDQDAGYIREHHEELVSEYRQVAQSIREALELVENSSMQEALENGTEISREELLKRLSELKAGLDTFEADKAEALLSEMGGVVYEGKLIGGLLSDVRQEGEDFEFTSASEKVEAFIQKVKGGGAG